MVNVAFGCCVGSWERFNRWVVPSTNRHQITALAGRDSIALAYNLILAEWARSGVDVGILQHDDLEILDSDAVNVFVKQFDEEPDLEILGVAGGSARSGLAWWNAEPVGWQRTDAMTIDFGIRTGRVDLLEGSLLVFNRRAMETLQFSERLGFHGYDEITFRAHTAVVDVATHHHTQLGFDNEQSHADWLEADRWFRRKWSIG